jgi:hypothetical protein
MKYLQGNDRGQMLRFSLEEAVSKDAFVRVVDVFADAIKQRLCVKIRLKIGVFWSDLRNLLFLLHQNTTGMSMAKKSSIALTGTLLMPGWGLEEDYCTNSR